MDTSLIANKKNQINIVLNENKHRRSYVQSSEHRFRTHPFSHIDQKFTSFIGLTKLKKMVKQIYAAHVINQKRQDIGLMKTDQVLHMLFKGNPGTGKTTVARKLAQIYLELGLLEKGQFIEAERADLVGEYIGQTAQKTRNLIQKSLGGVLFIDEAYSLGRGGDKDFGKEAIDTLVKQMEDHQNEFVLILAGYPREMERFLLLNPGLKSRFPFVIDFEDYSTEELFKIAQTQLAKREYRLTTDAEDVLKAAIRKQRGCENFSNGRYIRNLIEKAIRMQAVRLLATETYDNPENLMYITVDDLNMRM